MRTAKKKKTIPWLYKYPRPPRCVIIGCALAIAAWVRDSVVRTRTTKEMGKKKNTNKKVGGGDERRTVLKRPVWRQPPTRLVLGTPSAILILFKFRLLQSEERKPKKHARSHVYLNFWRVNFFFFLGGFWEGWAKFVCKSTWLLIAEKRTLGSIYYFFL